MKKSTPVVTTTDVASASPVPDRSALAGYRQDEMRAVWQAAVQMELPVAFWRQPRTTPAHAIVSLAQPGTQSPDFTTRTPGFYLAPFRESGSPLFLAADIRLVFGTDATTVENAAAPASADRAAAWRLAYHEALARIRYSSESIWYTPQTANDSASPIDQTGYEELVRGAIDFIRSNGVAKVVVSRTVDAALPDDFDPVVLFNALCSRYAHAFVSLIAVPGVGTWIGASPELLVAIDGTSLRTMALAGTQPRPDTTLDPASVHWGEKEIVEQELVSRYVRTFFCDAGYPDFVEQGPQTVTAGKVFHLQSSFRIDLPEDERLRLANQVLSELHPTSAVCGMPRREALSFIVEREGYDRSFYSGFLGPVFLDEQSTLYVNLRCMQLHAHSATLYVGGGITADSDPAAEWLETVAKSQTILDVLDSAGNAPAASRATENIRASSRQSAPTQRREETVRIASTPATRQPNRAHAVLSR